MPWEIMTWYPKCSRIDSTITDSSYFLTQAQKYPRDATFVRSLFPPFLFKWECGRRVSALRCLAFITSLLKLGSLKVNVSLREFPWQVKQFSPYSSKVGNSKGRSLSHTSSWNTSPLHPGMWDLGGLWQVGNLQTQSLVVLLLKLCFVCSETCLDWAVVQAMEMPWKSLGANSVGRRTQGYLD